MLHDLKLKKSPAVCDNLCSILCIDQKYQGHLMLKKLSLILSHFSTSTYFKSIGIKRNKIDLEEYQMEVLQEQDDDEDEDEDDDIEEQESEYEETSGVYDEEEEE